MHLVYSDDYRKYDFGSYHPMRRERWFVTKQLMEKLSLFGRNLILHEPRLATRKELLMVHSEDYLSYVEARSRDGQGFLDFGDTPAFVGMFEAASLMAGGSLTAAEIVATGKDRIAFNIGGGFHHAGRSRAAGFCIFNDVALAIKHLLDVLGVERVLHIDVDVHHGDGTQEILYEEPRVLKVDFHEDGRFLYPGTGFVEEIGRGKGEGYMVNVPLPPHTYDEAYLYAFREIVEPLAEAFQPDVITVEFGVDTHFRDPLAHLNLTTKAYEELAWLLLQLSKNHGKDKLVLFGGGGYRLGTVARAWTIVAATLAGLHLPEETPEDWRSEFEEEVATEAAPIWLRDKERPVLAREELNRIESEVSRVVERVKQIIFRYHL